MKKPFDKTSRGLPRHPEASRNPEENAQRINELTDKNLPDGIFVANKLILESQGLLKTAQLG